jgi:hypothetical protein
MHQVGATDPQPITPAAGTVSEGAGK